MPVLDYLRPKRRVPSLSADGSDVLLEDGVLGVSVGSFSSKALASNHLFRTALVDFDSLEEATRTVREQNGRYIAMFEGISLKNAEVACGRLKAREIECEIVRIL